MSESDRGPCTVLVIDDELTGRRLEQRILEQRGYHVLTASDGEEGLVLAKAERPHLILLDVVMPKLNGYQVLRRLKADPDCREIPVIMLTGRSDDHDIEESFKLGAVYHLEKPFLIQQLYRQIELALSLSNPPPASS